MSFHEEEVLGKAYDARLMRRLLGYLRPYKLHVACALLALVGDALLQLTQPYLVKLAIDRWYVEYACPWIDLLVLVSLVQRFVFRRRETVIERRVRAAVPAAGAIARMSLEMAA